MKDEGDYVESWEIGYKEDKSPSHRVRIFTEERVEDAIDKKDNMEKIMKWIWEDGIVIDEMSLDELRINRAVHLALSKFGEELKKELNIK